MNASPSDRVPVCPFRVGERITRYSMETYETDAVISDIRDLGDICIIVARFKNGITEEFKVRKRV
jgi:hypothetical protein